MGLKQLEMSIANWRQYWPANYHYLESLSVMIFQRSFIDIYIYIPIFDDEFPINW